MNREALKIPVFANGNIICYSDIIECLKQTGCDGVMVAG
jgi:tRNA-dihydrouridine synthase 1